MARSVGDAPGSMISLIEERSTIAVLACIIASPHSIAPSPERLNPLANSFSLKIKQQKKSSVIKSRLQCRASSCHNKNDFPPRTAIH